MKHVVDNRTLPNATKTQQFLRIERQSQDALLRAKLRYPQKRVYGAARLLAYVRIERGRTA